MEAAEELTHKLGVIGKRGNPRVSLLMYGRREDLVDLVGPDPRRLLRPIWREALNAVSCKLRQVVVSSRTLPLATVDLCRPMVPLSRRTLQSVLAVAVASVEVLPQSDESQFRTEPPASVVRLKASGGRSSLVAKTAGTDRRRIGRKPAPASEVGSVLLQTVTFADQDGCRRE